MKRIALFLLIAPLCFGSIVVTELGARDEHVVVYPPSLATKHVIYENPEAPYIHPRPSKVHTVPEVIWEEGSLREWVFYYTAGFNPLLLDPLQWLYDQSSPTNVLDKTTNTLHATYCASPYGTFDGVNDYADTGVAPDTNSVMEILIRKEEATTSVFTGSASGGDGFYIENTADGFDLTCGAVGVDMVSTETISVGDWVKIKMDGQGDCWVDYLDGAGYIGPTNTGSALPSGTWDNFYIGDINAGGSPVGVNIGMGCAWFTMTGGGDSVTLTYSENGGTVAYDVSGNGNHATNSGITEASFWANTQDIYHYAVLNGYSLYEKGGSRDVYVPYGVSGSPLSITAESGYTLTADRVGGYVHNGAPTSIKQFASSQPKLGASELYFAQTDILGDEEITAEADRNFDVGNNWLLSDASITISGGTLNFDGSSSLDNAQLTDSYQGIVVGNTYRAVFTISDFTSGEIRLRSPFAEVLTYTSNGTYTAEGVASVSKVRFDANDSGVVTTAKVDNVSVKEVLYEADDPIAVTWADYLAWVSYSDELTWLKFKTDGTSCYLSDSLIVDIDETDITEYNDLEDWIGSSGCGAGVMVPLLDVDGDYLIDVDDEYIFVSP